MESFSPSQHAVIIASCGRPDILAETLESLLRQKKECGPIILSVEKAEDLPITSEAWKALGNRIQVIQGKRGATRQLNRAIQALPANLELVTFLDDDVELAEDYLETIQRLFVDQPDVMGAQGRCLADGNIYRSQAIALLRASSEEISQQKWEKAETLYGCNMTVRRRALEFARFDERLAEYGWLNDADFSSQVRGLGRLVTVPAARLAHLAAGGGRGNGRTFGISQIINPYYLWRKGSLNSFSHVLLRHWLPALVANVSRGAWTRLRGNIRGLWEVLRGRGKPDARVQGRVGRSTLLRKMRRWDHRRSGLMRRVPWMMRWLLPILRAIKYDPLWRWTVYRVRQNRAVPENLLEGRHMLFIVGSGRSGTTLLGRLLSARRDVLYFNEPYHYWAALDPRTDVLGLFEKKLGALQLTASDVSPIHIQRFRSLFLAAQLRQNCRWVVEKTPHNLFRLEYLRALCPSASVIFLSRDGIETAESIAALAQSNQYRIFGRPGFNQWWGSQDAKWRALKAAAPALGFSDSEIALARNHFERGAWEWLLSMKAVERGPELFGDRWLELRHEDLVAAPTQALHRVADFLALDFSEAWIDGMLPHIHSPSQSVLPLGRTGAVQHPKSVELPATACAAFNAFQSQRKFIGRAYTYHTNTNFETTPAGSRIAILFLNIGGYHAARLTAAAAALQTIGGKLTAVQARSTTADHPWGQVNTPLAVQTLWPDLTRTNDPSFRQTILRLDEIFAKNPPQALAVPGWGTSFAQAAIEWGCRHSIPLVLMSESKADDLPRFFPYELWKRRRYVQHFSSAIVGSAAHADYLVSLGMPREKIAFGYDAVDNAYFEKETDRWRHSTAREASASPLLPRGPYFLTVSRFVRRKNIHRLIEAYAQYRNKNGDAEAWPLVICGDGILREGLKAHAGRLGLLASIFFPGFLTYAQMPRVYAGAGALVHPALTEQWGLVVNEAMAAGLPVVVSRTAGCFADLVQEGVNGFGVDPRSVKEMAQRMQALATMSEKERNRMGLRAQERVWRYSPENFGRGILEAIQVALEPRESANPAST